MNWDLIVQLIGYVISGAVALLVAGRQHKASMTEVQAKHDEQMALVEYRLKELEDKVDKHNNLVERMYVVETKLNLIGKRTE